MPAGIIWGEGLDEGLSPAVDFPGVLGGIKLPLWVSGVMFRQTGLLVLRGLGNGGAVGCSGMGFSFFWIPHPLGAQYWHIP